MQLPWPVAVLVAALAPGQPDADAAKAGILANIGPDGTSASGALPGIVVASPSTCEPDYRYTWVRDSSLVFKLLVDQLTLGQDDTLRPRIDLFVHAESVLQQLPNPSGSVSTGGLGEPKFNIDETAFVGPWGRPQRDGPALRATAIITYANWLVATDNASHVTHALWPIIQLDLDYVADSWNTTTFDLWEEIDSSSFFTTAVQHRALRQGAALAAAIRRPSSAAHYSAQADNVLCFLQSYWSSSPGIMTANTAGGRSGIDANSVLASVHTFDVDAACDPVTFQPCSDLALSNLKIYVDSFRYIYPINSNIRADAAIATGRYPEDVYQGGNPWYLTTFAVAEQLYDALIVWNKQRSLTITSTSLGFFHQFDASLTAGTYDISSPMFASITSAIRSFADGFVAVGAKYIPPGGSLFEQFSRNNGTPVSARDLTWSYASALTVIAAGRGQTSASWGAKGLTVPRTCLTSNDPTVSVQFNVNATTILGENIYLTGSVTALTNWGTSNPVLLSSANYPIWSTTVNLPASTVIQYKYIRIDNGRVTWESDPNGKFTTEVSGAQTLNDVWRRTPFKELHSHQPPFEAPPLLSHLAATPLPNNNRPGLANKSPDTSICMICT